MRKLCVLLGVCLLYAIPVASQTKTDKEREGLVGPVKSVQVYLVEFTKKDEGTRHLRYRTTYNTDGNISERVTFDRSGAITAKYIHTYDGNGRSTGYEEYVGLLDKTLSGPRRHVYTLNAEGRKVEYIVFESNETIGTRFVYKYDAKGNLIEEQWYAHTGQLGGRTVYTFDDKGNQTSQTAHQADGAVNWKNVSKYDDNGNRTEMLQYDGTTLRYKVLHSYDSKGRILQTEIAEFNSAPGAMRSTHTPEPGKVVYTYDDEKRSKEVATYDASGVLKRKVVYAYDERKNEVGLTMFNGDGSPETGAIQSIDIEYDSHGNWTRKTHLTRSEKSAEPQPYHAELRVISYY